MVYRDRPPLTDAEGDVRELTDGDFVWAVRSEDFGGHLDSVVFLKNREHFFAIAEKLGMEREAFLSFAPSKPGFTERATAAMETIINQARHAAE